MSDLPFYRRYPSDFIAGCVSLTLEQRGAYNTFVDLLYDRGEPLIDNERLLAGYLNVSVRKYRLVRDALLEMGKLHRTADGRLSNKRFEKEIEHARKTQKKLAENGSKGGRTRAENQKKANEYNAPIQQGLEPGSSITRNQKPEARSQRPEDGNSEFSSASFKQNPSGDDTGATPPDGGIVVDLFGRGEAPDPETVSKTRYAFEGKAIRLTQRDLDRWREAFTHIDLLAELWALDEWAGQQSKSWFHAVSGALAKRNREAKRQRDRDRVTAEVQSKVGRPRRRDL